MSRANSPKTVDADKSWLKRFLIVLALGVVLAVATISYYKGYLDRAPAPTEAYLPVKVKTRAGDGRNIHCEVQLVIDPAQEKALQGKMPMLQAVVAETLGNTYFPDPQRPDVRQLPEQMKAAVNARLPKSQQVEAVLVQNLLFGI